MALRLQTILNFVNRHSSIPRQAGQQMEAEDGLWT
jgi:hypothetical protein